MTPNLRTFRARTAREALERIKSELGPDAVILGTRTLTQPGLAGLVGRTLVEITAAPSTSPARPPRLRSGAAQAQAPAEATTSEPPAPRVAEAPPSEAARTLQRELAAELATRLAVASGDAAARSGRPPAETLSEALRDLIRRTAPVAGGIVLRPGVRRCAAFVGPAGSGKTTTVAKLAAHFALRLGHRVAILSLDMQRLGAAEQLRRYAELIGVPTAAVQTTRGVAQALETFGPVDLVLVDTPGLDLVDAGRSARLAALLRAVRPDEVHLVLPASLSPAVQERILSAFAPLGVSRLVLTRLDEAVGLQAILEVIERAGLELSYLTTGQNIPTDIREATGEQLSRLLERG